MLKTCCSLILCQFSFFLVQAQSYDIEQTDYALSEEKNKRPLNSDYSADAYSWLSGDGLRIYFTRDHSGDEIWKAERKTLAEAFSNPESINVSGLNSVDEIFSSWLTLDEKTIYFVTREDEGGYTTKLFRAKYDEASKSFVNPVKINLEMDDMAHEDIFISGPSLTEDGKQLFVFYSDRDDKDRIAWYMSEDGINYTFKSFLNNAENYCPGALADNGLTFYLTLRNDSNILVRLTRPNLNAEFSNPRYLTIDPDLHPGMHYYQPSVNTELGIVALTYGNGSWESNDLEIIGLPAWDNDVVPDRVFDTAIVLEPSYEDGKTTRTDSTLTTGLFTSTYVDDSSGIHDGYWLVEEKGIDGSAPDNTTSFDTVEINVPDNVTLHRPQVLIEIIPNPASGYLKINVNRLANTTEKILLEIFNLNGVLIKRYELDSSLCKYEVDISDIAEGIYITRVSGLQSVVVNKKIVIKR